VNVRLVVVRPESKRQTFCVRLPIVIGRSEEAKFRIQQDRVSRKHCELFEQDGRVHLRDLGSTNGTFLNGELIDTSVKHPLESGALVRVGSLEFRIEFESASAGAIAPAIVDEDRTVGLAPAATAEPFEVEHVPEEPAPAVEQPVEAPDFLTAERAVTADEPPRIAATDDAAEQSIDSGDEELGDFLKGLG